MAVQLLQRALDHEVGYQILDGSHVCCLARETRHPNCIPRQVHDRRRSALEARPVPTRPTGVVVLLVVSDRVHAHHTVVSLREDLSHEGVRCFAWLAWKVRLVENETSDPLLLKAQAAVRDTETLRHFM
eukprot:1867279-Rhodomonas_salina.1